MNRATLIQPLVTLKHHLCNPIRKIRLINYYRPGCWYSNSIFYPYPNRVEVIRQFSSTNFNAVKKRKAKFYDLRNPSFIPYLSAWRVQKYLFDQRVNNIGSDEIEEFSKKKNVKNDRNEDIDVIFLLEHPSVYTLGKAATLSNLKFDPKNTNHELYRVERGGQVTWHGPGQLVMYPILNITYHKTDVKAYIETLEEVIIRVLKRYNIHGVRQEKFTGVWVDISDRKELILSKNIQVEKIVNLENLLDDEKAKEKSQSSVVSEPLMAKVAAVGVSTSKWITMHGIAINVDPDLKCFDDIIPCGLMNKPVTSIKELLQGTGKQPPSANQVRKDMQEEFASLFDYLDLEIIPDASLPTIPVSDNNKDPEPVFK